MPIENSLNLRSIDDSEFSDIDEIVMKCAYATQNYFGRLFDERVYESDLAARLRAEGLSVHTQVPITLSYASFAKHYYLDLVVNDMLYELKVASGLIGEHYAQALNYAMLQNIHLVKLINFGEAKVKGRLLRNAVSREARYQATFDLSDFQALSPQGERLFEYVKALVLDWGTHLSCRLYNDAAVHEFGGEATCLQRIELDSRGSCLGTHNVQLYDTSRAFVVTGFSRLQDGYRKHLQVLLQHAAGLDAIQWLNLNGCCLEATTIRREPGKSMGAVE